MTQDEMDLTVGRAVSRFIELRKQQALLLYERDSLSRELFELASRLRGVAPGWPVAPASAFPIITDKPADARKLAERFEVFYREWMDVRGQIESLQPIIEAFLPIP